MLLVVGHPVARQHAVQEVPEVYEDDQGGDEEAVPAHPQQEAGEQQQGAAVGDEVGREPFGGLGLLELSVQGPVEPAVEHGVRGQDGRDDVVQIRLQPDGEDVAHSGDEGERVLVAVMLMLCD